MEPSFFSHCLHELDPLSPHTDLCVQATSGVFLWNPKSSQWLMRPAQWSDPLVAQSAVLAWISQQGLSWDAKHPFLDWTISGKIRAHLLLPPLTGQGFCLSLRRLHPASSSETAEARWGKTHWQILSRLWHRREPLIIAGATGSGKTTLLRDLIESTPSERIVAIEDTAEIQPNHPHFVALQTREANADGFGAISARVCVRQSLRMRPDRLLLGEVRGPEVIDLLQAANTGHPGIACTLHAHSARDAIHRLELLTQLALPSGIAPQTLRTWISSSFRWIVALEQHGVREIHEIAGTEGNTVLLRRTEG